MKVYGVDKLAKQVEAIETMKKIHKQTIARRVKELVAQGIDKELAKIMVNSYIKCGL